MKKGDLVIVWDGDFVGYVKGTLDSYTGVEVDGLQRWVIKTEQGYFLSRFVDKRDLAINKGVNLNDA